MGRRDSCPSHEAGGGLFVEFEAVPRRYSLQWFQALFVAAISKAEKAETLELRLDVLNTFFTYYVYVNVCRSVSYLAVPSCGGAFTPSTRLVSIRRGRGWFLFRF